MKHRKAAILSIFVKDYFDACLQGRPAVESALRLICENWERWHISALLRLDEGGTFIDLIDSFGGTGPLFDGTPKRWPLTFSPSRGVIETGRAFFTSDIQEQAEFPLYRLDAEILSYHSVLIVKLPAFSATTFVLTVHSRERMEFSDHILHDIEAVTRCMAVAMTREAEAKRFDNDLEEYRRLPIKLHNANAAIVGRFVEKGDKKLIRTAFVFAETGGKYLPTAEKLSIHISTLRYRLSKIETEFGLDLGHDDTRNLILFQDMVSRHIQG